LTLEAREAYFVLTLRDATSMGSLRVTMGVVGIFVVSLASILPPVVDPQTTRW
jgi:FtsH-binding integral membrane protein